MRYTGIEAIMFIEVTWSQQRLFQVLRSVMIPLTPTQMAFRSNQILTVSTGADLKEEYDGMLTKHAPKGSQLELCIF